ncbi:MAG: hypothetical protein RTU30_15525, partial [Candidatus Thorarchaeota archaeon]
ILQRNYVVLPLLLSFDYEGGSHLSILSEFWGPPIINAITMIIINYMRNHNVLMSYTRNIVAIAIVMMIPMLPDSEGDL